MNSNEKLERIRRYLEAQRYAEQYAPRGDDPGPVRQPVPPATEPLRFAEAESAKAAAPVSPLFNRILAACDGSEQAGWAVEIAGELAARLSAQLALVHVVPMPAVVEVVGLAPSVEGSLRQGGEQLLQEAEGRLPKAVKPERFLCLGYPSDEIVAAADRWGADLIVIGTHGRGRLAEFLLGGTAEAVIRHAACPVLAVAHPPGSRHAEPHGKSARRTDSPPATPLGAGKAT